MGVGGEGLLAVPLAVRVRLAHACVQVLAESVGVDLLHIKGAAVAPSVRGAARGGTDVDVLIRPDHVAEFDTALRRAGWELYSTFVHGSPFGHAQTYLHREWGYLDLHRFFPGIDLAPKEAFERLWEERQEVEIAGVRCSVPSIPAQALVLMLNSARRRSGQGLAVIDPAVWDEHEPAIRSLVIELDAGVGFAAATGTLEEWRRDRRYHLWKSVTEGGSRSAEWWGRARAARNAREALLVAARAPLVNLERLSHRLGRHPRKHEIVFEFFSRPARALRELFRSVSPTHRRRWGRR